MKYANIGTIFPEIEIEPGQDFNDEDLKWIQIQHLMSYDINVSVERLLRLYKQSPELVVSTILIAHNCELVREAKPFPYTLLLKAVKETWKAAVECIEAICAAEKSGKLYMNLLYRACSYKASSVQRVLDLVEQLLNFTESRKYLRDPIVWGLGRERVGVWDKDDLKMADLISNENIDIYILASLKLSYFEHILNGYTWRYVPTIITAALATPGVNLEKMEEYNKLREKRDAECYKSKLRAIFQKCEPICRFHDVVLSTCKDGPLLIEQIIDAVDSSTASIQFSMLMPTLNFPNLWETIGEYKLPCFLDGLLMRSLENISSQANFDMAGRLAVVLKRLLGDAEVKTNFCEFVMNIYNQERAKEVYDEKNNCSDRYALNSALVLLEVSGGIFRQDFVMKVGINKFATFCFFYTMRLFEISVNKLVREFQQTQKDTPLLRGFLAARKCLVTYFRFVLDVLNTRRAEVFMPVMTAIMELGPDAAVVSVEKYTAFPVNKIGSDEKTASTVHILDRFTALLDLSFEDTKAASVGEIIKDKEFITTFLLLQECLPELFINPESFLFFSTLLIFKNTFHTAIMRAIVVHRTKSLVSSDSALLKRLVRCYTDRFGDNSESNRFLLNTIFVGKVIPNDHLSLRMVNAMVADLDTHLRGVLDAVIKINELRRKIVEFEAMSKNATIPDDLSEDEEARYVDDSELARGLQNATDAQIRLYVELYLRNTPGQRFEDVYDHFKTVSFRETDPARYRLLVKIRVNKSRLDAQEKNLGVSIRWTNSFFNVLIDFTSINRKLFLNRNIFMRLCTIINGALMVLLGPKRGMYRLEQSKSKSKNNHGDAEDSNNNSVETYNPRLLLVATIRLVINLVSRNDLLIARSGFSPEILGLGLEIVIKKSLLSASNIALLSRIISVLVENRPIENLDEDIPEEFIDPLTCNLMEHPVKITTSNVIMDKSTFNQIMLNDGIDPFSRLSLTDTSYEECAELQKEINEYLTNKKAKSCQ